jgi:hypothetical protein
MKRTSGHGKQHADGFGRSGKLKLPGGGGVAFRGGASQVNSFASVEVSRMAEWKPSRDGNL